MDNFDREKILRELKDLEARVTEKQSWKRLVLTQIPAILIAIGTAVGAVLKSREPPPPDKSIEVYTLLRDEIERNTADVHRTHEDVEDMRTWLAGVLRAQGVWIADANGSIPPKIETLPSPLNAKKKTKAPPPASVQVAVPMPAIRPLDTPNPLPQKL